MAVMQLLVAVLLLGGTSSYRFYQDEVPNGDIVPHPCKPNYFWRGLGHANPLGGGPRNPFGRDFAKFHRWTPELCRMDSDGDKKTNGEELGDPNCVWTKGTFPERRTDITHPGVCDPWGSSQCAEANRQVSCETGEFVCDGINSPDVFNITLRFPPTIVPARETSYMCFTFDLNMLDSNTDYHLIASKPFIDNPNVMHHITLSGCDARSRSLTSPELCNMAGSGCQDTLGVWTLGMPGECVYREAGFKIGPKAGMIRLNMQHHWTNPQLRSDYIDSSGMVLYLTRNLRPNNAAYFSTGETRLIIPPGMDRVVKTSTCSAGCTRRTMTGPVKLMTGWNHMHYLGYKENVEHYRNGEKLRDLTPDEVYSYDNPITHVYNPPHEMRPGDNLETTCVYRSTSRTTTAMMGEGTFDEMCFGIFTFFPAENILNKACWTYGELELCDFDIKTSSVHGCSFTMLLNQSNPTRQRLFSKILDNCNYFGECRTECPAAIAEVRQHPCFKGEMMSYISDVLRITNSNAESVKFTAALHSCECPNTSGNGPYPYPMTSGSKRFTVAPLILIILGVVIRVFG